MDVLVNCRSSHGNTSLLATVFDGDLKLFQGHDTDDPARVIEVLQKLLGRVCFFIPRATDESSLLNRQVKVALAEQRRFLKHYVGSCPAVCLTSKFSL